MKTFMTIEEVLTAVRNDAVRHMEEGTFRKEHEFCDVDEENIHTMDSLYSQWAKDPDEASTAIYEMFQEEFPEYI
jgi:hypothetical protein